MYKRFPTNEEINARTLEEQKIFMKQTSQNIKAIIIKLNNKLVKNTEDLAEIKKIFDFIIEKESIIYDYFTTNNDELKDIIAIKNDHDTDFDLKPIFDKLINMDQAIFDKSKKGGKSKKSRRFKKKSKSQKSKKSKSQKSKKSKSQKSK